jgi:hypothetical protein
MGASSRFRARVYQVRCCRCGEEYRHLELEMLTRSRVRRCVRCLEPLTRCCRKRLRFVIPPRLRWSLPDQVAS